MSFQLKAGEKRLRPKLGFFMNRVRIHWVGEAKYKIWQSNRISRRFSQPHKLDLGKSESSEMTNRLFTRRCAIFIAIIGITICPAWALTSSIEQRSPNAATESAQNSSVLRLPSSPNFAIECKPATYGSGLIVGSCREALAYIPASNKALTFGLRGRSGIDVVTPWRWISCQSS